MSKLIKYLNLVLFENFAIHSKKRQSMCSQKSECYDGSDNKIMLIDSNLSNGVKSEQVKFYLT